MRTPIGFRLVAWCVTVPFLIAPLGAVILMSFNDARYLAFPPDSYSLRWYRAAWDDPTWLEAASTSAVIAASVAAISTSVSLLAAIGATKWKVNGIRLLATLSLIPVVIPGVVLAVALYPPFSVLHLIERRMGLVIAHVVLALPFSMAVLAEATRQVEAQYATAARTLGATEAEVRRFVFWPLLMKQCLASAIIAFMLSFDEPVLALFLAGSTTVTLPKRMWDGVQYEIDPTASAVAVLLIVLSVLAVSVAGRSRRVVERRRSDWSATGGGR